MSVNEAKLVNEGQPYPVNGVQSASDVQSNSANEAQLNPVSAISPVRDEARSW